MNFKILNAMSRPNIRQFPYSVSSKWTPNNDEFSREAERRIAAVERGDEPPWWDIP